jgi:hypothetical protein
VGTALGAVGVMTSKPAVAFSGTALMFVESPLLLFSLWPVTVFLGMRSCWTASAAGESPRGCREALRSQHIGESRFQTRKNTPSYPRWHSARGARLRKTITTLYFVIQPRPRAALITI